MHAHKMHSCKVYAYKIRGHEMHACEIYAYEVYDCKGCWISHAGLGMKAGACAMEHRQVIQPVFSEGRHDGTC